jgi:8-oxo-dGTP pyrophosphatase MutT (NUDIX family)
MWLRMNLKKHLFWIVSRTGRFLYSHFPVFGPLKAAMGIIEKDGAFLMIERNDGRGVSFPGGLSLPWERAEQAMVREVLEETGLRVTKSALRLRYYSSADIPVHVTVFDVEVEGLVRGSWEGTPRWLQLTELRGRVIPGQRRVVEMLDSAGAAP